MNQSAKRCWRSGKLLVVQSGADVSGRCLKCGDPAIKAFDRKLYWHHPALYFLIFFGIIPYALISIAVRNTCSLRVGLCAQHKRRRNILIASSWGLVLLALVLFVISAAISGARNADLSAVLLVLGILLLFAAAILGTVVGSSMCSPTRIDSRYAYVKGVGEPVLSDFADFPANP